MNVSNDNIFIVFPYQSLDVEILLDLLAEKLGLEMALRILTLIDVEFSRDWRAQPRETVKNQFFQFTDGKIDKSTDYKRTYKQENGQTIEQIDKRADRHSDRKTCGKNEYGSLNHLLMYFKALAMVKAIVKVTHSMGILFGGII